MSHWVVVKVFLQGDAYFRCQLLSNQLGHEKELKSLAFRIGKSELFFLTRLGPLESGL